MYAYGAHSVKCAVCNCVTPVGSSGPSQQQHGDEVSTQPDRGAVSNDEETEKQQQNSVLLIENPASVDPASGREMKNVVLGVTRET